MISSEHPETSYIFHYPCYFNTESVDAVIACTCAMLAAESEGLGTCMIGCVPPLIASSKELKRKYRIPENHTPVLALILGYHDSRFLKAVRRRFLTVDYR